MVCSNDSFFSSTALKIMADVNILEIDPIRYLVAAVARFLLYISVIPFELL
jgi:hypothetical protein